MATVAFPLPRKTATLSDTLRLATVNDVCVDIWHRGRDGGRTDTFIGLINTNDWVFYLAPCFGVDDMSWVGEGDNKATIADKIARGNFPGTTMVKANSTSSSDATMVAVRKSDLEAVYGAGNVCYAELDPVKGFDGNSHKSLNRWIRVNRARLESGDGDFWNRALGIAIQRDKDGYYMRFASTLNLHPGQCGENLTFEPKMIEQQLYFLKCIPRGTRMVPDTRPTTREDRDLPKQWSRFVEEVLARDLNLALLGRDNIQSRGEGKFSRLTRFDTGDRLV